ncbi:MAG: hypothetical protein U5K00_21580 [Melioribacteraceae bacterium]|nr:hypothetical protein [Melioribacteraceae bacterium]
MKLVIFILIIFLLSSCNITDSDDSENIITAPVPANKIAKLTITGKSITAKVIYTTPTPCWGFDRVEKTQSENSFTAKVFVKSDGSSICPLVIDSISVNHSINFQSGGDKTLRFWRSDSTYLDTTVTVN